MTGIDHGPGARVGALVVPRLRPGGPRPTLEYLRSYPPAGVIAFGRAPDDGRTLAGLAEEIDSVRADCEALGFPEPFFCCDLEEGAGLHFDCATRLVPALALAAADAGRARRGDPAEPDWLLSAAVLTAIEARERGVQLVLAPVVDVNTSRDNPIIAVRALGDEPGAVARRARTFVEGLHLGGAGACLKHWPGHGDTDADSHVVLPRVGASLGELAARELVPYDELLDPGLGVECVMVGHLDVPAITGAEGEPTTTSAEAIEGVLRGRQGFAGTVLSDGIDMGAVVGRDGVHARAVAAGCDGLLCPLDPGAAADEILLAAEAAPRTGGPSWMRLTRAARRMEHLRAALLAREPRAGPGAVHPACAPGTSAAQRGAFAAALAEACLVAGPAPLPESGARGWRVDLVGAEGAEAAEALAVALSPPAPPGEAAVRVVAAACRVSAGRGRAGLSPADERALRERLRAGGDLLLWFGSLQLLPEDLRAPGGAPWLVAHAPSPPLADAVGRVLAGRTRPGGDLPGAPG